MSHVDLSSDIRQRFDEMRDRLARLERSVSPTESTSKSPSVPLSADPIDSTAMADCIIASLSSPKTHSADRVRLSSEAETEPPSSDPFEAIQARLVRKLQSMESTRRGRSSTAGTANSLSPEAVSEQSPLPNATDDDGSSPLSAACTEAKSPSPFFEQRSPKPTPLSERTAIARSQQPPSQQSVPQDDSPLPVDPTQQQQDGDRVDDPRELFPPSFATHQSAPAVTTTHTLQPALRQAPAAASPTVRFSAEATILEPLNTFEILFVLRMRGLIASQPECRDGETQPHASRAHTMYVSPLEQAQLLRLRAAVAACRGATAPHDGRHSASTRRSHSQQNATVSARRPSTASSRVAPPARHSSFGKPVRASAPTASSLSKAKKTSYF